MKVDWQQVLTDYGAAVWRTVRCLVGNEADARDCYQTVFLEAVQLADKGEVTNWEQMLKHIARMRSLDLLRKRYRQATHIDHGASTGDAISRLPSPESEVEATELSERLRVSLASISPPQAEAFVMRYVEQLSYDQIAERTDSNRNAVGVLLNRARKQLRILLDEPADAASSPPEASS